ncbi:MAG: hypothetical protein ABI330_06845 [Caldimonas sp.]
MTRLVLSTCFAAFTLLAVPAIATAAPANACALLSEAEAGKLAGAPLAETAKHDVKPAAENGNDSESSCGHFPKGYHIDTADGPPNSGVLVELHVFPAADDAKRFYDGVLRMHTQMQGGPGGGSVVMPVKGLGEGAYLLPTVLPNSTSKISTMTFLKGSVVASIQVWTKTGSADAIARGAAAQVLPRLH